MSQSSESFPDNLPAHGQVPMLVAWGRCNKVPQTRWLKTADVYPFTLLNKSKTKMWTDLAPSAVHEGESIP